VVETDIDVFSGLVFFDAMVVHFGDFLFEGLDFGGEFGLLFLLFGHFVFQVLILFP
jgi:hypothetical protein